MSFTLIGESKQRARIAHRCSWCGQPIQVGEEYVRVRGVFEGEPLVNKLHPECDDAAAADYQEWGEGYMPYENQRPVKATAETAGDAK